MKIPERSVWAHLAVGSESTSEVTSDEEDGCTRFPKGPSAHKCIYIEPKVGTEPTSRPKYAVSSM